MPFEISSETLRGEDMSGTAANNLSLAPRNWRSGNDSTGFAPSNYAWNRPSASPTSFTNNSGLFREDLNNPNHRSWATERSGNNSDVRVPNSNHTMSRLPLPPQLLPYRPHEVSGETQDPWRLFENRVRTGPYGLNRFPLHPLSPMRIVVPGDEIRPQVNPRLTQFIQESPPRIRGQWSMQLASEDEESRLTREEQKKALKKLKKQVYNPFPKRKNKNWCLYYRDNARFSKLEEDQDDQGKSCPICLEDFIPKEEVLVTPCNHMFHDNCIVRWVTSNGQCPVCRFAIGERKRGRETALPVNNNNANVGVNGLMTADLISLIRAMEEAFEWMHVPR